MTKVKTISELINAIVMGDYDVPLKTKSVKLFSAVYNPDLEEVEKYYDNMLEEIEYLKERNLKYLNKRNDDIVITFTEYSGLKQGHVRKLYNTICERNRKDEILVILDKLKNLIDDMIAE